MNSFRLLIAAFVASLLLVTGGFTPTASAHSITGHHQSGIVEGYPLTTALWPIAPIPTCWDMQVQAFNDYSVQREIVRQAVASTWEAVSLILFVGWERCTALNNDGLTLVVNLAGPGTYGLGMNLKNKKPGMQLNFELADWDPSCVPQKAECIRKIAVHEFGHAVGFAHEQLRDDKAPDCTKAQPIGDIPGDKKFGPWDLQSVMNYCNPEWNNGGVLSAGDVAMVKYYYGDPDTNVSDLTPSIYLLLN